MFYSPLRYPGGKGKLTSFMEYMIDELGHRGGTYIEPFAGGAGIAIELLLTNVVSRIVINDYDKGYGLFGKQYLQKQTDLLSNFDQFHLIWKSGTDNMKYVSIGMIGIVLNLALLLFI